MEEKPNYYAIIPANVRYDSNINANTKLLYGEISSLCNKYGYCLATNEYFSKLYNVSTRTITEWIKSLEDSNYLKSELETKRYDDGTIKKVRRLYINHIEDSKHNHIEVSLQDHIEENFSYNNTSNINNNKKEIYKERFKKPTVEEVSLYCKERNNGINAEAFVNFYESKGWLVGKTPMKDWKAAVRTWELKRATKEPQILPTWFDKPSENEELTEEERKEFDDLLKT